VIALVVEDERDQRNLVSDALEQAGWSVELAEDGIAALGRIRRVQPNVILLDLQMPALDGFEMLKKLRSSEAGRAIPVIVTTGVAVNKAVRALANYVLMKPFSPDQLNEAVAKCLAAGSRA
jgi:CheY-like chemotaxis protein